MQILNKIQKELKAPKNQKNTFGGYNYRSCEDILEAVKPLLEDATLTVSDTLEFIGSRYYVKATVTIKSGKDEVSVSAYAREAETQKGMGDAQITGSASSYARKYALNGLFLIDDSKDDDSREHVPQEKKVAFKKNIPEATAKEKAQGAIASCKNVDQLEKVAENIKNSTNLSDIEKESLLSEVDFHYSMITTDNQ